MREGRRNFLTGLTGIVGLAGFVFLLLMFGELDALLQPRYRVHVHTENANGLRPGSNIELNGVPIGVVDEVVIQPDPAYPVRVTCFIESGTLIPETAEPFAVTSLLGSSAILEFAAPSTDDHAHGFLPTDGSAEIRGPIKLRMLEQVTAELDERLRPFAEALGTLKDLSATFNRLGNNLNDLLEPAEDGQPNIRSAVARLTATLDEAHVALESANRWLTDEELRADVRETVQAYRQLADDMRANTDLLTSRIVPVADELSKALVSLQQLMQAAREGDGTFAQLMNNPDLYRSLNDASVRLERVLLEAELLIEKLRSEGISIF